MYRGAQWLELLDRFQCVIEHVHLDQPATGQAKRVTETRSFFPRCRCLQKRSGQSFLTD